jgi:hypothetical protein
LTNKKISYIFKIPSRELRRLNMIRQFKKRSVIFPLIVAIVLFYVPVSLLSETGAGGKLDGYIFEKDGTSPVEGAVVKLMNISSGQLYESPESDKKGFFTIEGIEKGVYSFAVFSPEGDFGSDDLIGIEGAKTAKIAVSLNPYTDAKALAVNQSQEQRKEEEKKPIGRVLAFNAENSMAEVLMLKDYEKSRCRIHVKGEETDFKQKLELLMLGNQEIDEALEGQTVFMLFEYPAVTQDYVYLKCTKIPILWWGGALVVLAGSGIVIFQEDEDVVSEYKKK